MKKLSPLKNSTDKTLSPWRESLNTVIFGAETTAGKTFDIILIVSILFSVIAVMLDSVATIQKSYHTELFYAEWFFTLLFTVEYFLRIICVKKPLRYCTSFFGLVDLLSILPTYISLLLPGAQYLLVIRILRLLRIFRILKLTEYMGEASVLMDALNNSKRKILVFLYTVLAVAIVCGALMYAIEGSTSGFTSIPRSVYWSIVTLTTVGYGDIAPQSPLGQIVASAIMILGYGIIAVPTGIYSLELVKSYHASTVRNDSCPSCGETGHDSDAEFCKFCGNTLEESVS